MKQFDVKATRVLNGGTFFIRPFPAFVSANLSGEIASLIMPALAAVVPSAGGKTPEGGVLDMDVKDAAPALASINGDRVESLLKKLLVKHRNISVELAGEREAQPLTEDLANDLFCGDAQDMFILAFDVVRVNFSGFFTKIGGPFGALTDALTRKNPQGSPNTEN
jgi:hypothetical protein